MGGSGYRFQARPVDLGREQPDSEALHRVRAAPLALADFLQNMRFVPSVMIRGRHRFRVGRPLVAAARVAMAMTVATHRGSAFVQNGVARKVRRNALGADAEAAVDGLSVSDFLGQERLDFVSALDQGLGLFFGS